MGQQQYLIDTNAVIDFLGMKLPEPGTSFMKDVFDEIPNVSVITKIEVLGFNASDAHYNLLVNFINDSVVLELTNAVVDTTIEIRKKNKTKLPDAIIAATAIVYNLVLITRNEADFKDIDGLQFINPHSFKN